MSTDGDTSWVGRLLAARYRVGNRIARGGTADVYEATHEPHGRRVAIKIVRAFDRLDASAAERARREAVIAASLEHPNIVQVTDVGLAADEPPFVVMERLAGATLADVIERDGAMPQGRSVFIAVQLLSALSAAARVGVVHGDIKPANVMLTSIPGVGDVVKVLDFGFASLRAESNTLNDVLGGTLSYMSPEQARGEIPDARSDVHAVGAVLYEMLAGHRAFDGANTEVVRFKIMGAPATPLDEIRQDLDSEVVAAVARAMEKDPANRFHDANAMREALEPFSEPSIEWGRYLRERASTPSAEIPGPRAPVSGSSPATPGDRSRGMLLFLAGAVIGAATGVAALAFRGHEPFARGPGRVESQSAARAIAREASARSSGEALVSLAPSTVSDAGVQAVDATSAIGLPPAPNTPVAGTASNSPVTHQSIAATQTAGLPPEPPDAAFRSVIHAAHARFVQCFPGMPQGTAWSVRVDVDGATGRATQVRPTVVIERESGECLSRVMHTLQFPRFRGTAAILFGVVM